jgi:hypothetical protein
MRYYASSCSSVFPQPNKKKFVLNDMSQKICQSLPQNTSVVQNQCSRTSHMLYHVSKGIVQGNTNRGSALFSPCRRRGMPFQMHDNVTFGESLSLTYAGIAMRDSGSSPFVLCLPETPPNRKWNFRCGVKSSSSRFFLDSCMLTRDREPPHTVQPCPNPRLRER